MSDEANLIKLKNVVELLSDDKSLKVGDLLLSHTPPDLLRVSGWSRFNNFRNINRGGALIELTEIKALFQLMISRSTELNEFVQDKVVSYSLLYDDAGKCGISVCVEENGELTWYI
ncbi:MAG: hypothetical protein EOP48_09045 [Sphingobacteriales bacterium]|nr:MAG: hypothetical protein EOP48_09045 [Sphingobacteriales bacterium]